MTDTPKREGRYVPAIGAQVEPPPPRDREKERRMWMWLRFIRRD